MAAFFNGLAGLFGYKVIKSIGPLPYKFTWEDAKGYGPDNKPRPVNPRYFATEWTANTLLTLVSAFSVVEHESPNQGGPYSVVPKSERWLTFPDGTQVNAGLAADSYDRAAITQTDHDVCMGFLNRYVEMARNDYRNMKERGEIPWEE